MLFSALTVASTVLSPINCGITERRKGEGGRVGERGKEEQKLKEDLTLLTRKTVYQCPRTNVYHFTTKTCSKTHTAIHRQRPTQAV